jgi:hypothetical protein
MVFQSVTFCHQLKKSGSLQRAGGYAILPAWENQRAKAAYPPLPEVAGCRWHPFSNDRNGVEILPPDERKEGCQWLHILIFISFVY